MDRDRAVARVNWLRAAGLAALAGAGLGLLGPFGTYGDLTTAERYAYWIGLTLLMWLQQSVCLAVLRRETPVARWPLWAQAMLAAVAGAIPTTFEVAYVEGLLRVGGVLTPASLAETFGSVVIVAVGVFVPITLLLHPARRPGAPQAAASSLMARLPPGLGRTVVALTAEDHYLRVHTEAGDALIHHRFSDAVREMGAAGLQVHRSWWISRDAVEGVEREGERYVLVLRGGLRAPVSRTFGLAVRQAGLIP